MLNHLFAFLDTQLVEPPWSAATFLCIRVILQLWWGGSSLSPPGSTGHWFTDMPSVAAYIWLAWKKSEGSLIPSREEKTGFKVVYLLPVTEDVENEAMQREELLLMWKTGLDMGLLCVTLIIPGSRSVYHAACLYRKITWGVGSFFSSCFQPC